MVTKYLIRDVLKELYWVGEKRKNPSDALFTMYPIKSMKFASVELAEKELDTTVAKGVYTIDKLYIKQ